MNTINNNHLAGSSLLPNLANYHSKAANVIDRTHFSGPSGGSGGGGYHHHVHSGGSHGGGKHSIALSALTLLAFLFFLNILQNCMQEHMDMMTTTTAPTVIVMQAQSKEAREADKRKGEIEAQNISIEKHYKHDEMEEIPIKLKTRYDD